MSVGLSRKFIPMKTLVISNDFPPRRGGIESFVLALANRIGDVVVFTAAMPGGTEFDATLPYPVFRDRSGTLLPSKRVEREAVRLLREYGCDRVLIGSSVPLGLLAPALRAAGAKRIVALTHGHEVWWSKVPGADLALRRVGDSVDVLTDISDWTRRQIGLGLSAAGRAKQRRLAPGVDTQVFYPGVGRGQARKQLGLDDEVPIVLCCARLVERKGQDLLIKAWPQVLAAVPNARLVIVGDGPYRNKLEALVAEQAVGNSVTFVGSVPWTEVPIWMDSANVFAMPSRSRRFGLEPEGLGIVYLEAAACGKPVIVGRSGGAPEAVLDRKTGYVVDPRNPAEVADRIIELLTNPAQANEMGALGRAWVSKNWQWDAVGATCAEYLRG